jgi:hypothetical protein
MNRSGKSECGRGKTEKKEDEKMRRCRGVGPVVVPKEWDYAAARMRKGERRKKKKLRRWEVEKVQGSGKAEKLKLRR